MKKNISLFLSVVLIVMQFSGCNYDETDHESTSDVESDYKIEFKSSGK